MNILLPINFLKFWYVDSITFFLRVWQHSLLFLEEDLAVGLMLKLLFVPLFHDTTIFGRILSFLFRFIRILIGLVAYMITTIAVALMVFVWFGSPIYLVTILISPFPKTLGVVFLPTLLLGMAIFIGEIVSKPPKRLWHIKGIKDIWQATKLKPADITWEKLTTTAEVKDLLFNLEISLENFAPQKIVLNDDLLIKTLNLAKEDQAVFLTPAYFWVAFLHQIPHLDTALLKLNLSLADFEKALNYLEFKRNKWRKIYLWDEDFAITHLKGVNRGWLGAPTPNLDAVSEDLTKLASRIDLPDFVGREAVVSEVINILSQDADRNVMLVGETGCGKTTLVQSLAKKIIAGDAPDALASKRLVSLDLPKLLSGAATQGELAQKVKSAFEEVKFIQDIIIFVDEIQNMGIGEAGSSSNLYALMLPYLESNQFQFIAATEASNYAKIIEKNSSFARLFHKVEVNPASIDETIQALFDQAVQIARYKKITMTYVAIKELANLAAKLIHDRVLPDAALSVLQEAEVMAINYQITSQIIKDVLQRKVNIPIVEIDSSHKDLLLNLEGVIHQKMIDQQEAVKAVSDTLRRGATALREENRPIGSFLFVGPTGVGKTELAKTLAAVYFKNDAAFLRFDMSEYQTPDAVNRLLGTEDNPGELTEAVKNKPYALLLLDEFEKANPTILTVFLQVLDDGRLTDASGKTIDFTNTIIIATSNVASLIIAEGLQSGMNVSQLEPKVKEELLKVYKPELVNRFDSVVIFKPLSQTDLAKIVGLKLNQLQKMLHQQGYLIEFAPELVSELAKKGFDPVLGARPLRRLIQDTIEAKLSRMILENKLLKGTQLMAGIELLA